MSPDKKKTLAAGIMTLLFVIVSLFLLGAMAGCASRPAPVSVVNTAALSGHLDRINGDLSESDAKAVIVEQWLKTHR